MKRNNTLPHNHTINPHSEAIEGCAECADDLLEKLSGCRFDDSVNCTKETHPDCWR